MKAGGQSSVEYLMIIALTFAILIPSIYLFFNYARQSSSEIIDAQIFSIGHEKINAAESMYFSGDGSKTVLEFSMPEGVNNITILHKRELVFALETETGRSDAVFFSRVNITSNNCLGSTCALNGIEAEGFHRLRLESVSSGKKVR